MLLFNTTTSSPSFCLNGSNKFDGKCMQTFFAYIDIAKYKVYYVLTDIFTY